MSANLQDESETQATAGTVPTGSTPVYELVRDEVIKPTPEQPLVIPEGAVVAPSRTDTRTELEAWIR
jgi:2,3,4,5-tetrahydropyridine-2-carboxylate N-succinyltransferase